MASGIHNGNVPRQAGDHLQFDDSIDDADRCAELVAAAALLKVSDLCAAVRRDDNYDVGKMSREAAEWINEFGIGNVTASELTAEVRFVVKGR